MEINKRRTTLMFVLINVLVIGLSFGLYYLFIKDFENKYIENHIKTHQLTITNKIDNAFTNLTAIFNNKIEGQTINELNQAINTDEDLIANNFVSFNNNDGTYFTFLDTNIHINNNKIGDYPFGFFTISVKKYFFVFADNVVGVIDFDEMFSNIIVASDANDVFVMSNLGTIFYNANANLFEKTLNSYLTGGTAKYNFDVNFPLEVPMIELFPRVADKEAVILFSQVEGYETIYIAQQFYKSDIKTNFVSIDLFLLAVFIIIVLLNLIVLTVIFYILNKKNADIEKQKLKYYYDKPYIIRINRRGKIVRKNKRFLTDFLHLNLKRVNQFFASEQNVMEKIKRGSLVVHSDDGNSIGFMPIKIIGGFYLVGDFLHHTATSDSKAYNLAYYNQVSGLGNKNLFDKNLALQLEKIPTEALEQSPFIIGLSITDYNTIISYLNRQSFTRLAKGMGTLILGALNDKKASVYYLDNGVMGIICEGTTFKDAESTIKQIIKYFEKPINIGERNINIEIAGAILKLDFASKELAVDEIYYRLLETLKRAGKTATQKYLIFDEHIINSLSEKEQIRKDLELGIQNKEFVPYFQPQYNHSVDRIDGFEALMRWDNPRYINKSPLVYIEVAEEFGLMDKLGKLMMEATFQRVQELQNYNVTVSINVSPSQILGQGFINEFLKLHKRYNLKPNSVALEITESILIQSFNIVNEKIKLLKNNGIRIDLDDFGTGYSSLQYIKELNFDTIKIDKVFIDYIETDKSNKAIVQMIVSLGKAFGASIVAEGVETEGQMNYLIKNGVNLIQGYFISRPIPFLEAKQMLQDYNVNKEKSFKIKGDKK